MKIVMVTPSVGNAFGQERALTLSCRLLQDAGHSVRVVSAKQVGSPVEDLQVSVIEGLAILNLFSRPPTVRRVLQALVQNLTTHPPDLVHWHDPFDPRLVRAVSGHFGTVLTAHTLAPTCPQSLRLTAHSQGCSRKAGWACLKGHQVQGCLSGFKAWPHRAHVVAEYLRKDAALKASVGSVIAISRYVHSMLRASGWPVERLSLVPNAVPFTPTAPASEAPWPLFVFAARLVPLKGLDLLLEALAPVANQPWTLWVCGEGPERARLEAVAHRRLGPGKVVFQGRTSPERTLEILSSATALVAPNRGPEAFGLTVAEACTLGVPVISARVPGLTELIEDGVTGSLFSPDDVPGLTHLLRSILESPLPFQTMAQRAQSEAQRRYSGPLHLEGLLGAYEKSVRGFQDQTAALGAAKGSVLAPRRVYGE